MYTWIENQANTVKYTYVNKHVTITQVRTCMLTFYNMRIVINLSEETNVCDVMVVERSIYCKTQACEPAWPMFVLLVLFIIKMVFATAFIRRPPRRISSSSATCQSNASCTVSSRAVNHKAHLSN